MSLITLPNLYRPKEQIAELVEAAGIAVPARFQSFDDAFASGMDFMARSEHPREFAGESGILENFAVTPSTLEKVQQLSDEITPDTRTFYGMNQLRWRALQRRLRGGSNRNFEIGLATSNPRTLSAYCRLYEITEAEFLKDVSYSYWQLLGGWDRTVVADDTVAGRYHLFTTDPADPKNNYNYTIVENGHLVASGGVGFAPETIFKGAADLIGFYESVRQLPFFDPNHCPIIECQLVDGLHYFLQYHIGRDFKPAEFELSRAAEADEVEIPFVRGATSPAGLRIDTALYYPRGKETLMPSEDASFDLDQPPHAFSEIMSRRRQVFFLKQFGFGDIANASYYMHLPKTLLFKPVISLAGGRVLETILTKDLKKALFTQTRAEQKPARIPLHVISDGRRALVKRLD